MSTTAGAIQGAHPAIAIAPVVAIKDVGHRAAHLDVLVRALEPGQMVEEGAAWQSDGSEQLRQRIARSQGINQLDLLPIREELLVDAQIFFRSSFAFFRMSCSSCRRRMSR